MKSISCDGVLSNRLCKYIPDLLCQDTKRQSAGRGSDDEGFSTRLWPNCPEMWGSCSELARLFVQGPRANTTASACRCSPSICTPTNQAFTTSALKLDLCFWYNLADGNLQPMLHLESTHPRLPQPTLTHYKRVAVTLFCTAQDMLTSES